MTKPSAKTAKYFKPVLVWLDQGAPHVPVGDTVMGFDMNTFIGPGLDDWQGDKCGTACCIAGALALMHPEKLGGTDTFISNIASRLEMTTDDYKRLFYMNETHGPGPEITKSLWDVTPYEAAATIRHWIKTGDVIWDFEGTPDA